jgi:hypothetical protein
MSFIYEANEIEPLKSLCSKPLSAKRKALWSYFLSHSSGGCAPGFALENKA